MLCRRHLLLLVAGSVANSAAILPLTSNVSLSSLSAQGQGCPKNSVSSQISPDGSVITFGFDDFAAYYGPAFPPTEQSKTCVINVTLSYPVGYSFSVLGATYHGSALLDAGLNAIVSSSYRIATDEVGAGDVTPPVQTRATIEGSFEGIFTQAVPVGNGPALNSPCSQATAGLQIATRISIASRNSAPSGNLDGDPPLSLTYEQEQLGWTACTA
ncbi:a6f87c65-b008-4722-82bb-766db96edd9b [Thermothielavioides terrestris]|jgi:hypothetical protein|uniref:Ubiquitin 3 binding protein But2 C-terminal domain-containing protein n=2 Tax=Thermothielavioides terrestris TaxID=2587410 RepID=G2RCV7_THETT|nr:uncharacterized protein THITE_2057025 [Thermothielavioides terrestris NRRL 8126]AEO69845.1 hypothetical protein THITE_2057025 [Thermothielavioides terrestris NRRL 8126]SPQ17640.1 a6f87c65-b008-4722-82bb-766db96edd9b [Thermothielavioides terrestris]